MQLNKILIALLMGISCALPSMDLGAVELANSGKTKKVVELKTMFVFPSKKKIVLKDIAIDSEKIAEINKECRKAIKYFDEDDCIVSYLGFGSFACYYRQGKKVFMERTSSHTDEGDFDETPFREIVNSKRVIRAFWLH